MSQKLYFCNKIQHDWLICWQSPDEFELKAQCARFSGRLTSCRSIHVLFCYFLMSHSHPMCVLCCQCEITKPGAVPADGRAICPLCFIQMYVFIICRWIHSMHLFCFFQFHSTLVHPCKCFKVSLLMNNIDYCGHDDDFRLLPQYFYNFSGVTDRGCNDGGKEQFCKFQSELSAVIQAKASKKLEFRAE